MEIQFLGAAQTVTGSKYLLTCDSKKYLIDCGLYQGEKEFRLRNWSKLPFDPKNIEAVILTHAHIDHSGYLPLLVKNGFAGKIYATHATLELCKILLPDSGYLQEEEANFANRHKTSKHSPALPLYTALEAKESLKQFYGCDTHYTYSLDNDTHFQFNSAGHILGASTISFTHKKNGIIFSGDVGRLHDPIMLPPEMPALSQTANYHLVLESTYGDRLHDAIDPLLQLEDIINRTVQRHGSIIIPAFAVGRAQLILYYIFQLKNQKRIPDLPIFLDSPMAVSATELFCQFPNSHHLSAKECQYLNTVAQYVKTVQASKQLDTTFNSKIIVSASGMATGGRVLHHIKTYAPDKKNTIVFVGFQAPSTRGDRMVKGEKSVKMLGEWIDIHAEIIELQNMSAHADYQELLQWLKQFKHAPKTVFITHGEHEASIAMGKHIETTLKWKCVIPNYLSKEKI